MIRTDRPTEVAAASHVGVLGLAAVGGLLVVGLVVAAVGMLIFARLSPPQGDAPTPAPPPAPRLEVTGGADLATVRRIGAARLSGWAWTDPGHTSVRIPIERAMQLRAAKGWADAEPAP